MTADELLERAREVCRAPLETTHPGGVKTLYLDPGGLTIGDLDARLGERTLLVPMPFADRISAYQVEVAGAPFRCTVLAYTSGVPEAGSALTALNLRQDP